MSGRFTGIRGIVVTAEGLVFVSSVVTTTGIDNVMFIPNRIGFCGPVEVFPGAIIHARIADTGFGDFG